MVDINQMSTCLAKQSGVKTEKQGCCKILLLLFIFCWVTKVVGYLLLTWLSSSWKRRMIEKKQFEIILLEIFCFAPIHIIVACSEH